MIIKIQNIFTKHKMRNLGNMNDLYNAQDVILLCEIIENHFQAMNNTYGNVTLPAQWAVVLKGRCPE